MIRPPDWSDLERFLWCLPIPASLSRFLLPFPPPSQTTISACAPVPLLWPSLSWAHFYTIAIDSRTEEWLRSWVPFLPRVAGTLFEVLGKKYRQHWFFLQTLISDELLRWRPHRSTSKWTQELGIRSLTSWIWFTFLLVVWWVCWFLLSNPSFLRWNFPPSLRYCVWEIWDFGYVFFPLIDKLFGRMYSFPSASRMPSKNYPINHGCLNPW